RGRLCAALDDMAGLRVIRSDGAKRHTAWLRKLSTGSIKWARGRSLGKPIPLQTETPRAPLNQAYSCATRTKSVVSLKCDGATTEHSARRKSCGHLRPSLCWRGANSM